MCVSRKAISFLEVNDGTWNGFFFVDSFELMVADDFCVFCIEFLRLTMAVLGRDSRNMLTNMFTKPTAIELIRAKLTWGTGNG